MIRTRRPPIWLSLAVCLVSTTGCAPQVSKLVAHKHYREAICAAHDGGDRRRSLVSDALMADTELYLHVHRMTLAEIETILGDHAQAKAVLERVHLVRMMARTNSLPIDDLGLDVKVNGADMGAAAAPVSWETLAVATRETLPTKRQYKTYATVGNVLRGLGAVLTVGVSLPFTRFQPRTVTADAPLHEYEQQMPIAATLIRQLAPAHCDGAGFNAPKGDAGLSCTGYFVFDKSPRTQWSLTISELYVANTDLKGDKRCSHRRVSAVNIGRTDEWPTRFGPQMQRVEALGIHNVEMAWDRKDR